MDTQSLPPSKQAINQNLTDAWSRLERNIDQRLPGDFNLDLIPYVPYVSRHGHPCRLGFIQFGSSRRIGRSLAGIQNWAPWVFLVDPDGGIEHKLEAVPAASLLVSAITKVQHLLPDYLENAAKQAVETLDNMLPPAPPRERIWHYACPGVTCDKKDPLQSACTLVVKDEAPKGVLFTDERQKVTCEACRIVISRLD